MIKYKKDIAYQKLKADILTGRYPISFRLPTEKQLAQQEGVSFITIRSSLKMLEDDGLIQRIPGKGTFVIRNTPERERLQKGAKVVLILPDFKDAPEDRFNRSLIYGTCERIALEGNSVEISRPDCGESWFDRYMNKEFDGIIWDRPPEDYAPLIELLRDAGCAQVIVNRNLVKGVPSCLTDYNHNIRRCMQYLISIGHQRIGLIDLIPKYIHFFRKRQDAFLQELRAVGCENPQKYLMQMDAWPRREWNTHIRQWLQTVPDMTAVLCFDHSVFALEQAVNTLQIRIPQDLSLIQLGEYGKYSMENSSFYCIMTDPRQQVGKESMQLIRKQLNGEFTPEETLIQGRLHIGESCQLPADLQQYLQKSGKR